MTTTTAPATFDAAALRRGFEQRDADAMLALYADDATVELVDAANTPSAPTKIVGREAIRAHLTGVFARDMTHELERVAVTGDALGYAVRCRYPDGTRVVCASTAELHDGRIVRELGVQAWDA